ncbi:Ribosomal protein S18 acetylase RimI [Parapedobacter composti]|uniref:Ribosomal protein S18 acetylase RimI n=1 Tax=Parapedobacter composti TaxID=623281 RepID=A0A1I1MF42_9SPHI|nr:GNAT family N-acetyltransferase [Parapedobacter composti]SFC84091.1 Ribosomal protein S18 acetylase RimI [Parapedobacter composti]
MIVTTTKKSVRKPASSYVNISRMDYELVCNVLLLLEETGMDDEEISFLLGKRNQYFFKLIDPRKKQKLKTDQADPLAPIFGKPHNQIIPLNVAPGEMIQLHHATRTVDEDEKSKTVTFSHIVYPEDGGDGKRVIWQKTSVKGERYKIKSEVLSFLKAKVSAGYFSKPRLALPLYLEMKRTLEPRSFAAMDLERALAKLLRGKGVLMCDSFDSQEHYVERHEIFAAQPADVSRLLEIWEASVRATHHFLSEGDIRYFLPLVRDKYIPSLEVYGIRNLDDKIMGFMGLAENKVEMLFIHPDDAGRGLGAFLIAKAVKLKGKPLFVDVNEQNPAAIRFYERIGFKSIGRSELDATGKPFPIIHMELPDSGAEKGEE